MSQHAMIFHAVCYGARSLGEAFLMVVALCPPGRSAAYWIRVAVGAMLLAGAMTAVAAEIYTGEPLAEALPDLTRAATPVVHELSLGSALLRTDVFRLADGLLVVVTSSAEKLGEPYMVKTLRVTPAADVPLTERLPTVSAVKLSP